MQVRGFRISKLNMLSENPEVAILDSSTSTDDLAEKVLDLKELADGL